jgi:hypothetical protein
MSARLLGMTGKIWCRGLPQPKSKKKKGKGKRKKPKQNDTERILTSYLCGSQVEGDLLAASGLPVCERVHRERAVCAPLQTAKSARVRHHDVLALLAEHHRSEYAVIEGCCSTPKIAWCSGAVPVNVPVCIHEK